jgi:hypothetical protein
MKQHPINLMPASVRARTQAGLRAGRFVAVAAGVLVTLVTVATHSRLAQVRAASALEQTRVEAEEVFAIDATVAELKMGLDRDLHRLGLYRALSFPLPITAVLATAINNLPPSVTLDQIDLTAAARGGGGAGGGTVAAATRRGERPIGGPAAATAREPRTESRPARTLVVEMVGFAATDEDIAELISRLEQTPPFQGVTLDFTRTRKVNQRDAREFRLSFRVDLNARYELTHQTAVQDPQSTISDQQSAVGDQQSAADRRLLNADRSTEEHQP